ncbi:MBL fold metallo-hydrolase [Tsuneonella sp. HG249]
MHIAPIALLAAGLLAGCASASAPNARPYELIGGHMDLAKGPDGNTVILEGIDGLIVVDTGRHPEHAASIVDRARRAGNPVVAIVNTHWHLDHTTGNRDVRRAYPGAEVVATGAGEGALTGFIAAGVSRAKGMVADPATEPYARAIAERMLAAVDDRASFLPAKPLDRSETRTIAGRAVEFHVAPAAVTEADLWLVAPDEELAIVGDLVVAQAPFFDTGCEEGWAAALDAIAAARWDTLIPGHGAPMDRAAFGRWRTAFDGFVECGRSEASADACAERWLADANGFYSDAERESVRQLIVYYVTEVLRAPVEKRMAYCAK